MERILGQFQLYFRTIIRLIFSVMTSRQATRFGLNRVGRVSFSIIKLRHPIDYVT